MSEFELSQLSDEERAFVESVEGLHHRIEALKILFPEGPMRLALEAMQKVNANLVAAVIHKSSK